MTSIIFISAMLLCCSHIVCTGLLVVRSSHSILINISKRPVKSKRKIFYFNIRVSIVFGPLLRSGLLFLST